MGTTAYRLQDSFNGGEVSRRLQSRPSLSIYNIAGAEIRNMAASVEGAIVKRPGTWFRAAALASSAWLSPYTFSATQSYVLVWSEGKIRFVTNNALLEVGGNPVEVVVPYTAAHAPTIWRWKSFDVQYLAHGSYPFASLRRTAADAFSYQAEQLKGGPFGDINDDDTKTVTVSGVLTVGGAVTIDANTNRFNANMVGGHMLVEAADFADVMAWQTGLDNIGIGNLRRSEGRVYEALTAGRTGTEAPFHLRGDQWDGDNVGTDINGKGPYGVKWRYRHDRYGVVRITGYTDANTLTGIVERAIPLSLAATATRRWAHSLFSADAGYPQLCCLWRGRMWLFRDNELAGSVSAGYRDFSEFDESGAASPDQAIRLRMDIPDRALWVRPDRQAMIIGTASGEYAIGPINPSERISADNLQIVPQSGHGSKQVEPLATAAELIFAQRGGRKLRAATYDFGQDRYLADNMTLWARQITRGGIRQLCYQAEPEELLWMLKNDGTAASHPYNPAQDTKGWCPTLELEDAAILSQVSTPSPDGERDDVWILVERDGEKSIEQLADWWDEDAGLGAQDGCHLDSALAYDGAPATVFGGLEHLAGKEVGVLADGAELPVMTVEGDGTLTLPQARSRVLIGRLYTARYITLRPDVPMRDGTSIGRLKRVIGVVASLLDSFGVRAGDRGGKLDRLVNRAAADPMDSGPSLFSDWTEAKSIGGGYSRRGQVTFEDRSPFPWVMPALVKKIDVGDK
ncbi:MAG: hypothetical protein LCH74_20215 [Proteobacteria bacterium]|nr:hypothetical protein [Pseudomonadota bacterium]